MSLSTKTLGQEIRSNLYKLAFRLLYNNSLRLWRLLKYGILRFKDERIIYGKYKGREVFDYPINRNQHTAIKGKPGFGKSALAVNLAIQNIEKDTRVLFLDPHGNPYEIDEKKKGAIVKIYQRVKKVGNVLFLTVNQRHKIIGTNFLFLIGSVNQLEELEDDLMNSIFYDSMSISSTAYEVINAGRFVFETVLYYHNAYFEWLAKARGKSVEEIKLILQSRQITVNDLANLDNNPRLIDLFIEILGYEKSKYHRPDLVNKWLKIREKEEYKLDVGLKGVIGRFKKIVSTSKSKLFFESNGFTLLDELKKRKSVLCDLSGLSKFTIGIIAKILLIKVYSLHELGKLRNQTEFYIDEASYVELPNLPQIITQGRKFELALTLIYQFTRQFKNTDIINAIQHTVVNQINFRNKEADFNAPIEKVANLRNRKFIFENNYTVLENVKTTEMPEIKREVNFEERGESEKELRKRMTSKINDIYGYFTNV